MHKSPLHCPSFTHLEQKAKKMASFDLKKGLEDSGRTANMTHSLGEFHIDYSKNRIGKEELSLLNDFAREMAIEKARDAMVTGQFINETEKRQVLHMRARERTHKETQKNLKKMETLCRRIIEGTYRGYSGKKITEIVNIGIGGSDLGPHMVCESLSYNRNHLGIHFVSNIDGHHIDLTLKKLSPETTLFVVVSKTFTTLETMTNAMRAKEWLCESAGGIEGVEHTHFIAVTANGSKAQNFGVEDQNIFEFSDSVGGRFSLWSPVGLSIALATGFEHFKQLLDGAHQMDRHFQTAQIEKNIPIQAALLNFWNFTLSGHKTYGIFPYDQRLWKLPAFLQQLIMESHGKNTDRFGQKLSYQTSPVVWGEVGTNAQHAFFQLLHQGTQIVPCDFILVVNADHDCREHHKWVLANCLAQTRGLAIGKEKKESLDDDKKTLPFKDFEGGRPSTTIMMERLSPFNLGMLLALYEHQVFCLGHFQNIYSFDQWGVELGKVLAKDIYATLGDPSSQFDSSTNTQLKILQKSSRLLH